MEKIKDLFHDFSDVLFAVVIASIMFVILTLNLGSWFNESSNTVLADNSPNVSGSENNNYQNGNSIDNIENNDNQNKGSDKEDNNQLETEDTEEANDLETEDNNEGETEMEDQENKDTTAPDTKDNEQDNETPNKVTVETKKIVIPNGTPSNGIAAILKDKGLIDNTRDFIKAADDLRLANRLRAGTFEIPTNATVENMVKIIAGQRNM